MKKISFLWMLGMLLLEPCVMAQDTLSKLSIDMNGFSLGKEVILRGNKTVLTEIPDSEGIARFEVPLTSPALTQPSPWRCSWPLNWHWSTCAYSP